MAEYLSPGVYVEEFESGLKPMEGVSTSTAGFIGMAERGPIKGAPEFVASFADYQRKFGGHLSENAYGPYRFLPYAIEQFFLNGGSRCFIMRVIPSNAKEATAAGTQKVLDCTAANPGEWGNKIKVRVRKSSKAKTQIIDAKDGKYTLKTSAGFNEGDTVCITDGKEVYYNRITKVMDKIVEFELPFENEKVVDTEIVPQKILSTCEFDLEASYEGVIEKYEKLSFNMKAANFVTKKIEKSDIVKVKVNLGEEIGHPVEIIAGQPADVFTIELSGGSDGSLDEVNAGTFIGEDRGPGQRTGLQSFIENDRVSIMAIPGITMPAVQLALTAHCENLASRFAILDIPMDKVKVTDVQTHRAILDSSYVAMYHPWVEVFDMLDKKGVYIPPSGSIAGVYARSDTQRGVHKAPANEGIKGCTGLSSLYNKAEQDILNPAGVNLIRALPGKGIQVWGARTCSSDGSWKYVNVRRLFIFVEESIKANTNWAVFEPNDEMLWARVGRTISSFLTTMWRNGALAGTTEDQAFFVNIGRDTMTQDDILNGRLICVIGIAPVRPAEFVIFRITQKMEE
jgi:phage tail sheath protein FI